MRTESFRGALLLTLLITLLIGSFTVAKVSPVEYQVGVKAGDWIEYDVTITGAPPEMPLPEWMKVEFLSVEGTIVTARLTMHMLDGTENSETITEDVAGGETSEGLSGFVIPANSEVGDSVNLADYGVITIGGESTRTYAGASRTVVYGSFSGFLTQLTYYWDKQTGVMVESSAILFVVTSTAKAMETNIWQTTEELPPPSSISAFISPTSITIGQTVAVSGSITPARSGVTVTLTYTRPDGTTFTRAVTTATGGSYADDYTPDQAGSWKVKASWPGDENYAGSESSLVSFNVGKLSSSITCSASPTSITFGQTVTVSGTLTPTRSGTTIILNYTGPLGIYITRTVTTTTGGSYSDTYTPDYPGSWEVEAIWEGDENYAMSSSSLITFSVSKLSSSITLSVLSDKIEKGRSITISGSISPPEFLTGKYQFRRGPLPGVIVDLTYEKPDGSTITRTVTSSTDGSFEDSYTPEELGIWKVTASWLGDEKHEGDTSSPVTFVVEESPILILALGVLVAVIAVGVMASVIVLRKRRKPTTYWKF